MPIPSTLSRRPLPITLPSIGIGELCRKYHIRKLSLFGSVLREDFSPTTSDIDMLVEFEEGCTPGLGFFRLANELSDCIGYEIDLCTKEDLSKYFRQSVVQDAVPVYENGEMYEFT